MSSTFGPKITNRGSATKEDGLVFYFDASNKQSIRSGETSIYDLVSGHEGRLTGASWINRYGGAIQFDGVDDFMEFSTVNKLGTPDNMTIELVAESFNGNTAHLVDSQDGRGAGFAIGLEQGGKDFVFGSTLPPTSPILYHSHYGSNPSLMTDGPFKLTIAVRDNNSGAMYYNGTLVSKDTNFASGLKTFMASVSYPLTFGTSTRYGSGAGSRVEFFKGWIYSFKIYNTILDDSDVRVNRRSVTTKYKISKRIS